jgi:riboflavin kinase / FMN adenylyltransferase
VIGAASGAVVTIGNFDGVHRGHLQLIERTRTLAAELGARPVALTFDPHPAAVVRPDRVPPMLQPVSGRIAQLRAHGIDEVVVLPFDAALASLDAAAFVDQVLVAQLGAVGIVVGENFRFGRGAAGDVATLAQLGAQRGIVVAPVALVRADDDVLSSSALRARLAEGDVEAVARGLGRPFTLEGEVVHGEARGRTIGFPTANVEVVAGLALPGDGVYACWATPAPGAAPHGTPAAGRHPSVVNVGRRPTFEGTGRTVEAHLLDVPEGLDLYGQRLSLAFVARIRGEQRFDGPEALVARIREDVNVGRELLGAV